MRRSVLVFVLTALLIAIMVFGGSAWAQLQPPAEKGCTGLETAASAQKSNPTKEDDHSKIKSGPESVPEQHKCKV
jgi:hypothetical protein